MKKQRYGNFSLIGILLIILLLNVNFLQATELDDYADLVLINGNIITVDTDDTIAEAVAAKDSLILQVGTNAEIQALIEDSTDVCNLNGKTVTPGMIDAHTYLMYYNQGEIEYVNLIPSDVQTVEDNDFELAERKELLKKY